MKLNQKTNRNRKKYLRNSRLVISILALILSSCTAKTNDPGGIQYLDVGKNTWNVEVWNSKYPLTSDYDGNVSMLDAKTGSEIWNYPAGTFVFDLKVDDIDNDGRPETAVVTAMGDLIVLDEDGQKMWSFKSKLALYNVGIGNFTGDEKLEVTCGGIDRHVYVFDSAGKQIGKSPEVERLVHRIAVGNLDYDEYDEIFVVENRTIAQLFEFEANSMTSAWRKPLKVPDEMINWENPRGGFFAFSVHIDDIDYDGITEILLCHTYFNKQAVMITTNEAEPLWISKGLPPFRKLDDAQIEFYSTAFVRTADLFPAIEGKEVISVAGGMFRIWDNKGNLLGSQNSKVGFTDIETDGNSVYLGSSPNGDNFMYKLTIDDNWEETVSSFVYKGLVKNIKENTEKLRKQAGHYQPESVPEKVYDIKNRYFSIPKNEDQLDEFHKEEEWFRNRFPYDNLRLIYRQKAIEETPPLDEQGEPWSIGRWQVDAINGTMTIDEILERARWVEENEIPTVFYIGHSCMPFITLETAEKILQAAPNYCMGFQSMEDEQIRRVPKYFEHYFKPLADLCVEYGNKQCVSKNKGLWWITAPSHKEVFNAMFEGGRENVSGAATEDSNSRTPEINLMGRGGLWQAGVLAHNDVSIHADIFSFNRYQQWEYPKAGHPYLRLLTAHTSMGMTQISSRIGAIVRGQENPEFQLIGEESTDIFYHLLGKGIIFSPEPKDALGYSSVGVVMHKPPQKWLDDAHNGHSPEIWVDDEELHNAFIPHNGSLWGMTNTPKHAFQKVAFNKQRQFGYQVPPTPYGLIAIVPEFADLNKVANVSEWWHTDGIYIWKEGEEKLTGMEAAKAFRTDLEKAAERLPFRQTGEEVFMQVLRVKEDHYRLLLADPGWLDPKDRKAEIKIQLNGSFNAEDILAQQQVEITNNQLSVQVPAGLFVVVDVKRN